MTTSVSRTLYNSPSPRSRRIVKYGSEVNEIRNDLRKNFFQRLRIGRQNQTDSSRRSLSNSHLRCKFLTMVELKRQLYSEQEAKYKADQLLEEINQIEDELLQEGAQMEAAEYEQQFENIINQASNKCIICENVIVDATCCDQCAQDFFTEDF